MRKRFKIEELKAMGLPSLPEEGVEVVLDEITGTRRWSTDHRLIFRIPGMPEKQAWETSYSIGSTEYQEEAPWEYEAEAEVECTLVELRPVTIEQWVPTAVQAKPSEIALSALPLGNTMGKAEVEMAAALIIRACQLNGDTWQSISGEDLLEVVRLASAGNAPEKFWMENPFLSPDYQGLIERGFAALTDDGKFELTQAGHDAIAVYRKPGA